MFSAKRTYFVHHSSSPLAKTTDVGLAVFLFSEIESTLLPTLLQSYKLIR